MSQISRLTMLLAFSLFLISQAYAQSTQEDEKKEELQGIVRDIEGNPLENASLSIKEGSKEIFTDKTGHFSLEVKTGETLVCQKDGFHTKKKTIGGDEKDVKFTLFPILSGENLIEVTEGKYKERALPGAVSSIDASAVKKNSVNKIEQAFNGTLTGLYTEKNGGQRFGFSNQDYFLRGRITTGGNQPLVMVDGMDANINLLDPGEVESIRVLKDASELAMYGLRGANGVILINTKDGSPNDNYINVDSRLGVQTPSYVKNKLNAFEYATLHNEANKNDEADPVYIPENYSGETNPFQYPDTDLPGQFLKDQTTYQHYTFSTGGGNETAQYFALVGYMKEGGLFALPRSHDELNQTNNERYNFRTNLKVDMGAGFKIDSRIAAIYDERRSPWRGSSNTVDESNNIVFNSLLTTPANAFPILNPDSSLAGTAEYRNNPLGVLTSGQRREDTRQLTANIKLTKDLGQWVEGLSAMANYGFENYNSYYKGNYTSFAVYHLEADSSYTEYGADDTKVTSVGNQMPDYYSDVTFKTGLEFERNFDQHLLQGSIVYNQYTSRISGDTPAFKWLGTSGRLLYGFKNRYFAQLTGSYHGSNNYLEGDRYGFFPAASLGWIVSEESFLSESDQIDYLKFKISHGISGNNRTGAGRFLHRQTYYTGSGYGFGIPNGSTQGAYEGNLNNPQATWEKSYQTNIGMEMHFFKSKLKVSMDYFYENRSDIMVDQANMTPSLVGNNLPLYNAGEITNKGIEGDMMFSNKFGPLTINTGANIIYMKNQIIDLKETAYPENESYRYRRGNPLDARFGFVADGLYKNHNEIDDYGVISAFGRLKPGDIKYVDQNDDGVIDEADRTVIGNAFPELAYGFNLGFEIKGIDLFLQAKGASLYETHIRPDQFSTYAYNNRFTDDQNVSHASYPRLSFSSNHNQQTSTFWQDEGHLFRLSTVEMGYTLPERFANKISTSKIRIYTNLNNMYTSKSSEGRDLAAPNAGYTEYPLMKTIMFGLSVNL